MEGFPERQRRRPLPVRRNFVFRDPPFLKAPKSALREAYIARRLDALDALIAGPEGIPELERLADKNGRAVLARRRASGGLYYSAPARPRRPGSGAA